MNLIPTKHLKRDNKRLSKALYDAIDEFLYPDQTAEVKNLLIHLADCVCCGTVTPLEAYDALRYFEDAHYFPVWLSVRESNYSHLF